MRFIVLIILAFSFPAFGGENAKQDKKDEWRAPIICGDMAVGILEIRKGKVPVVSTIDKKVAQTEEDRIYVALSVVNGSENKKVDFRPWYNPVQSGPELPIMKDEIGNAYKMILFPPCRFPLGSAIEERSIYPKKAQLDAIAFELPVEAAKEIALELPARNFGGSGMLKWTIPAQEIKPWDRAPVEQDQKRKK